MVVLFMLVSPSINDEDASFNDSGKGILREANSTDGYVAIAGKGRCQISFGLEEDKGEGEIVWETKRELDDEKEMVV